MYARRPEKDNIYNAVSLTFGKKQAKTVDWFEAHLDEIQPFIDEYTIIVI